MKPPASLPRIDCFNPKTKEWESITDIRQLEAGDIIRTFNPDGSLAFTFNRPYVAMIKAPALINRPLTHGEYDTLLHQKEEHHG